MLVLSFVNRQKRNFSDLSDRARKSIPTLPKMPEKLRLKKKMLVRSVVRVRNMAFSLNMNWRLHPSARSVWCWFWKSWEPGFKSSRCNKCLYYMFLWLNCSIRKLFFVSIIRRRTSWLLSYHMEGRPYWQRVKFTGVSAVSVFNI